MFEEPAGGIVQLPHPPISLAAFLIVESALCAAWTLMRQKPRNNFNLDAADEDTVTHELYERLYDEIFDKGVVAGFDRQVFATVRREPKVRSFNREHLDKMPDLLIEFVDRPPGVMNSQYGLFIECKPVDSGHSAGVHYCGKGIIRFVKGEYAWAMTGALMVGYARAGYTILPKLSDALRARPSEIPTLNHPYSCRHSKGDLMGERVHISEHARTFSYVETGRTAPAIMIRHLWLKRD
jgi:hypothetical protein